MNDYKFYTKKEIGDLGEKLAKKFLVKRKYQIFETNYHYSRLGEIDIIASDPRSDDIVFIEVKTRKDNQYGWPEVAVDQQKRQRLNKAIHHYLAKNKVPIGQNYRLDCIAIILNFKTRRANIKHFECI